MLSMPQASVARPTGDQEVGGLTLCRVGNILSWRFDHEMFSMVSLSLICRFMKGSCQFLAKEYAQY